MAIEIGVNAGFVTTAPTADPTTSTITMDWISKATRDTSPAGAIRITEIGWWCDNATEQSNFEVGLYTDTGTKPDTRLFVDNTNAKGTDAGWKRVTVDWSISANTTYWIATQLDNTATATYTNRYGINGGGDSSDNFQTSLTDPWGSSTEDQDGMVPFYAVVEVEEVGFTRKIKIAGTFQDKPIKTKVAGTFEDKPIKIKVGGTFQDA